MKISFEKLRDGACVITVVGKNGLGETFMRQEIIKSNTVFDAIREQVEMREANKFNWQDFAFSCPIRESEPDQNYRKFLVQTEDGEYRICQYDYNKRSFYPLFGDDVVAYWCEIEEP